jgi:hypothetical protein
MDYWLGIRAAYNSHVTGAHIGDDMWRGMVANETVFTRWSVVRLEFVMWLERQRVRPR